MTGSTGTGLRLALGAALILVVLGLGCGRNALQPDGGRTRDGSSDGGLDVPDGGSLDGFIVIHERLNRKLDLLFMVDNSSALESAQANLVANLPRFMDVLKALPDGLPDLHIAVITSDLGIGTNDIPGCNATGGDNGIFRSGVGATPFNNCTTTGLNAGAAYVSSTGGASPQTNFTGDITQVVQCILPVGSVGCGFEQPLASVVRALGADGKAAPVENQGFLRPDAYLGIVLLTNEDDCSAVSPSFYDVKTNTRLSSPLGPPGNFRCSEFGHLCDGAPPRRTAPSGAVTDVVTYQSCVSSEGAGMLTPVAQLAAQIKSLKADPSMILVSSIQGPATPYQIRWKAPAVDGDGPWPDITHSCTMSPATTGSFADPGVRLQEFTAAFGANGLVYSICQDNYGPALNTIAMKLSYLMAPRCIPGPFVDANRDASDGVQPDCTVIDRLPRASGAPLDTPVPACAGNGNIAPCWSLRAPFASESCAAGEQVLQIDRGGVMSPDELLVLVKCATCAPGTLDAGAGCPR
jgi:hypothetical protein